MKISLLTPTGMRSEAFKLCEKWVKKQTIPYHEWIVVCDSPSKPTKCTMGQKFIKGPVEWKKGLNTQRANMNAGIEAFTGDILFIIEDDEYYSPKYLESMVSLLGTAHIAGISASRYYHIGVPGYKILQNYRHSSLCHTVMRKSVIPRLLRAVNSGEFYFDIYLWKYCREDGVPLALINNTNLSIGIKGMPGRAGLSNGHKPEGYISDHNLSVLKGWLGKDVMEYKSFL